MNDGCTVTTTYYGGFTTCNIANDKDPAPCGSESCEVCDVLCSSFGNAPYGVSSRVGTYGPGVYTYKNPALAHHVAISEDDQQSQAASYFLIQCRVVTRENSGLGSKTFVASIDEKGVMFCAQSAAIIPTHLLIYRLKAAPDTQHPTSAVNSNLASINTTPAAVTPVSVVLGQPKSSTNTGSGEIKVKTVKGKAKVRVKGPVQEAQRQSSAPNQAVRTSHTAFYPPVPPSALTPASASNQVLLSTPAPDPAAVSMRALIQADNRAPVVHPPIPPSVLSPVSAANQGRLSTPAPDPAAAALRALKPAPQGQTLARRQGQEEYDDDDYDPYADLPEHPPGRLPDFPPTPKRRPGY
ncbi:hypothetical protein FS837_003326 [Tulasnella sp. UAMH 9824]|nr:hypothetical protein FS837_003326 [Tulasnella sp. UAMH 9824]